MTRMQIEIITIYPTKHRYIMEQLTQNKVRNDETQPVTGKCIYTDTEIIQITIILFYRLFAVYGKPTKYILGVVIIIITIISSSSSRSFA